MNPLEQSLELQKRQAGQIPTLVLAVQQARGEKRVVAAEMLQQAIGNDSKQLIQPIYTALDEDVRRIAPIDILEVLWDLQTNPIWNNRPTERVHRIKQALAKYLTDTGIATYLPEKSNAWYQEFAGYSESDKLLKFFHRLYPEWLKLQHAIEDGFIQSPIDVFKWHQNGRPQKFRWGKRFWQSLSLKRQLPPIVREHLELDSEYRVDVFSPRPKAIVRSAE